MLCYRCGSHVPDTSDTCPTCGQKYDASARQGTGASARRRGGVEGAPYKAGDVVAGRFEIEELVGAGPVGFVFKAQDQANDVHVALKVINPRLLQEPEERTQFSLVLKVGKKLNHPYLSRVYEEGFDQDRPWFTAQLVEGMTLRRMMEMRSAKGQPFTLREVEPLLAQLGDALDAAHRYGPHSDLKPENIIVLPDVLKVTDYGLALGIPRPPFVQAQKGYRAEGYIAPEYTASGEIDTRMDIYSLAVIVGEMLTGLMPDADGIPEILMKNPDLPPAFEALYRRALNANPLARPKTAGEFASEFASIVAQGPAAMNRPPRQAPALGNSALSSTARSSEKPPPPVPTDQLPIASVSPPVAVRPPPEPEPPPADATQPMDAEMLAAIMAAPTPAAAKAALAAARSGRPPPPPGDSAAAPPPPPPQALSPAPGPGGTGSRPALGPAVTGPRPALGPAMTGPRPALGPAMTGPRPALKPAESPRPRQPVERRPLPLIWLVLLTIAGLGTGSGVGYLLLKRLGPKTPVQGTQPEQPTPPGPGQGGVQPANPLGSRSADPMAPAGRCPPGMRLVSGGTFKRGSAPEEKDRLYDERALESVQVPSFCIDEYEYPNQPGTAPTVDVSWDDAQQSCRKGGKRLCTEDEWEKACKGPGNARFPYGNDFDASVCNTDDAEGKDRTLSPSGHFAQCRSAYQVADLSGNVAEWTSSPFESSTSSRTQKGGAYDRPVHAVRCSARISAVPTERKPTVGFRCCAGVQP